MNKFVTEKGYLIKKDKHSEKILSQVKKELTIQPEVLKAYKTFGPPKTFTIYKESPNYFFLPRFYGREKFGMEEKNTLPEGESIDLALVKPYAIMPHQVKPFNALVETCRNVGGGVLCLSCGLGKTAISICVAFELKAKTLVIVNKEFLLEQWVSSIAKFSGGKARIGRIQQNILEVENKDFVIAMVHTIAKKDYPEGTFNSFKLCIVDECHHLGSDFFSKSLVKIQIKYMIGLSATPRRADNCMSVVHSFLGPLCHSQKREGTNKIVVKRFKLKSNDPEYETLFMSNGTKNTAGMITNLSKSEKRNILIIDVIRELMKEDRQILLLSGRREHLTDIYKLLSQAKIITIHGKPLTYGYYYGNQQTNKKVHRAMLEDSAKCDIVLGTISIAAEALDIATLNTEIMATPFADIEQAVGRILRKFHTVQPLVVDLIDSTGNFTNQARTRLKYYHSEGYKAYDEQIDLDMYNSKLVSEHISKKITEESSESDMSSASSDDADGDGEANDLEGVEDINDEKNILDDETYDLFSNKKIAIDKGKCIV